MKRWIKLFATEWLEGSVRVDLSPAERSVWLDLLVLGGMSRNEGRIERSKGVPYSNTALMHRFRITKELLRSTLGKCLKEGRLWRDGDGTLVITNWAKYQAVPDDKKLYIEDSRERELRERRQARVGAHQYPDEVKDVLERSGHGSAKDGEVKDLECAPRDLVECICPRCGEVYQGKVDHEYAISKQSQRVDGRLVITCLECKPEKMPRKEG